MTYWRVRQRSSPQEFQLSSQELKLQVSDGRLGPEDEIFDVRRGAWIAIARVPKLAARLPAAESPAAPAVAGAGVGHRMAWGRWGAAAAVVLLAAGAGFMFLGASPVSGDPVVKSAEVIRSEEAFVSQVRPLIQKYCNDCHSPENTKGEVTLTQFSSRTEVLKDRATWRRVMEMLYSGEMPPKRKPQPTQEERNLMTAWIEEAVNFYDCSGDPDPGRVTIRRLNRVEYDNTINDLLGVELKLSKDFPSDDVGDGFDNIADVLSMPPLLMEKYLIAAEAALDAAVVSDPEIRAVRLEYPPAVLKGGNADSDHVGLWSNGETVAEVQVPHEGEYLIQVFASGQQAGPEKVRMAVKLNDRELRQFEVPATPDKPGKYEFKHRLKAGRQKIAAAFLNDYYNPEHPDPSQRDRNMLVHGIELNGPIGAGPRELPPSHKAIFVAHPKDGMAPRDAARKIADRFLPLAFRRPVRAEEVEVLLRHFDTAQKEKLNFEASVKHMLAGALISPHFLFRIEPDRPGAGSHQAYELNDFELASRLSYFLWASMPDATLFDLARAGRLKDPSVLEEQARRMLADSRARSLVDNFASQWLQLRHLDEAHPDPQVFPEFTAELKQAMRQEAYAFMEWIIREDRSVLEILDSRAAFVNEKLARHYGIEGVQGDSIRRIDLPDQRRGGLLTTGAVLTLTSNPTRTNVVKRGKWVLENLLGTPPPPAPPEVPDLNEKESTAGLPLRRKMELHREDPICASCHNRLDPLGFGLENFDALGRWREREGEHAIDASGVLPDGSRFSGPQELRAILMNRKQDFLRCASEKLLTYALGRGLEYYDACSVRDLTDRLEKNGHRFSELVAGIVRSPAFRMRRPAKEVPHG